MKFSLRLFLIAMAAMFAFIALSPKWVCPPAVWIGPPLLLILIQNLRGWKALLSGWLVLALSGLVANYHVMPFPGIAFVVLTLITSLFKLLPYLIHKWLSPKLKTDVAVFVFPAALVLFEFIDGLGGAGTWNSMTYKQSTFFHLIQLTSVTGIWGITFLIGWSAAILSTYFLSTNTRKIIRRQAVILVAVLTFVMVFGAIKTNPYFQPDGYSVRVAGITANNVDLVKVMYEDYFGKPVSMETDKLSQASPELAELQKGFVKFIENPADSRFQHTHTTLQHVYDSLLDLARHEAVSGAKLISFSEGLFIIPKDDEEELISKAKSIAKNNAVYLVLGVASLLPGPVEFGKQYVENKAIVIDEQGNVVKSFFKNKPVPMVEPSVPGDGIVPVIETPFGRIAISICYDADFPALIRQAGREQADILILPSGDWREIAPYHADMARLRAVENGFSLIRIASGARSYATNSDGAVLASSDFYSKGGRVLTAQIQVNTKRTLYSWWGDVFVYICALYLFGCAVGLIVAARRPK